MMTNTEEMTVHCTPEESQQRVNFCQICENLTFDENNFTMCKETGCNINLMSTFKFKTCPKENW